MIRMTENTFGVIVSWTGRIIILGINFLLVPTLIDLMGVESYAFIALLLGLLPWLAIFEFGLGVGLQNNVAAKFARKQAYDNDIVTSLPVVLTLIMLFYILLSVLVDVVVYYYFKGTIVADQGPTLTLYACTLGFINVLLLSVCKVYLAERKSYLYNAVSALAWIISYLLIEFILDKNHRPAQLMVALLILVPQSILLALLYCTSLAKAFKRKGQFSYKSLQQIAKKCKGYWINYMAGLAVLGSDFFFLSAYADANDIVDYFIYLKIFTGIHFFYTAVLTVYWPIITGHMQLGETFQVKRILYNILLLGFIIFSISTFVLWLFHDLIYAALASGKQQSLDISIILLLGSIFLLRIITDCYATFLMSIDAYEKITKITLVQAVLALGLQFIFCQLMGFVGSPLGILLSFVLLPLWILPYRSEQLLRQKDGL